jgi:hypothetical protein
MQGPTALQQFQRSADAMLRRYDFVSAGMGALLVTTVFVLRGGQDPGTALWITASATFIALVSWYLQKGALRYSHSKHLQ